MLFCPEDPVSSIAESRTDIFILIELTVQMADIDLHIRMGFLKAGEAFRCRDDRHEFNLLDVYKRQL